MKNLFSIFLFFAIYPAFAQHPAMSPLFFKSEKWETGQFVGQDNFGNSYSTYENEFRKIASNRVSFYKNVSLGKIHQVDLQNPLQIVLFYKQFTSAVLLDNQLNETTKINFSELNIPLNPEAVSLASQNRLWLYDMLSQKLGLFDILKNTYQPITQSFNESIRFYQSDYNYFYWVDTKQNLYVSNLFGKVNLLGVVPSFDQIQVVSPNQILVKKDNELYFYNLENLQKTPIAINEKSFVSFSYKEQILSIFTSQEIYQYKIILP
jgi:hypothetical protein